jgi:hypothetical protein
MAIIKATRTQNLYSVTITWPNITTADTGEVVDCSDLEDLMSSSSTSSWDHRRVPRRHLAQQLAGARV